MSAKADALNALRLVLRRDLFVPSDRVQGLEASDTHRACLGLPDHRVVVDHLVSSAWRVELLGVDLRCAIDSLGMSLERLAIGSKHRLIDSVVRLLAAACLW